MCPFLTHTHHPLPQSFGQGLMLRLIPWSWISCFTIWKLPFQTASDAVTHVCWFQHVKTPISWFFCSFWTQPSLKLVSTDRYSCVQQARVGGGGASRDVNSSQLPAWVMIPYCAREEHICCEAEEHVSAGQQFKTHTTKSGSLYIQ